MDPADVAPYSPPPAPQLLFCQEPRPGFLASRTEVARRSLDADFSDIVRRAQDLLAAGDARDAVRVLLRALGDSENLEAGRAASDAAIWLSLAYALVGHDDDAHEWLCRVQRYAQSRQDAAGLARVALLHTVLCHLAGDDVQVVRLGNQYLAQRFIADEPALRGLLLAVMGSAYLRLAQIAKARQCVTAIVENSALGGLAASLGALLMGELDLAQVVRQSERFRSQLLFVDELRDDVIDPAALARSAQRWFSRALASSAQWPAVEQSARAGMARARLVGATRSSDWRELEQQLRRMAEQGFVYGRERAAVQLGIWRLLHDDPGGARLALQGVMRSAMTSTRGGFAYDALFYGALACAGSGDAAGALLQLEEFMARIRTRHLSRVALPPPNLAGQSSALALVASRPKSTEIDDLIVARVTALVRDNPNQMLSSDDLAIVFGVSRRTLQYRFRRATGKTPKEFVTALRVEHAHELLAGRSVWQRADLEKLASATGFANYRTFVRAYRARYRHHPAASGARDLAPSLCAASATAVAHDTDRTAASAGGV